jgi:hypothetical protein
VRFHLVTSVAHTPELAGDLIDLNEDFVPLPPIVMVLQAATGHLWALGRIGARQPFYGSPHDVVPADTAADWAGTLLALDWRKLEPAAFAATHLARVTDDRARDLPLVLREQIVARLLAINAPPAWVAMVSERVELDEAVERRMLGESLPPGLKLMP